MASCNHFFLVLGTASCRLGIFAVRRFLRRIARVAILEQDIVAHVRTRWRDSDYHAVTRRGPFLTSNAEGKSSSCSANQTDRPDVAELHERVGRRILMDC